jgi:hypothetical protein
MRRKRSFGRSPIADGASWNWSNSESYEPYGQNTTKYARKCCSELCRHCVRSPRKHAHTSRFTGSHREGFCGGKSLNLLREQVFRYHSVSVPESFSKRAVPLISPNDLLFSTGA